MVFPLSLVGWLAEPLYLRFLGSDPVITVSESTRRDLARYGFDPSKTSIISEGIQIEPLEIPHQDKSERPTILSLGAMRSMKRTLDQIKAFEIAKQDIPDLQLKLAGRPESTYGQKVLSYIKQSRFKDDIEFLGRISQQQKQELLRTCHIITVTSVKEGWGLIVTEAASQGTPAAVYDVDGLRDSVKHRETGLVTAEKPDSLAGAIITLITDIDLYQKLQFHAHMWSKEINFTNSYKDFKKAINDA